MSTRQRVVVFGGTGHFGARICRRLAKESGLELVVTSRSMVRADGLVADIRNDACNATISSAQIDQDSPDLPRQIGRLDSGIVIHTAGPYQGQDYAVAKACIQAGCHYVDLADGRQFVAGFNVLNGEANKAGVVLVSGASTLPGISSAVVDRFRGRFRQIDSIETSIAPAHQTPRGPGTVTAVLSYCGRAFATWRDGRWRTVHGWQDLRWQRYPSLGRRLGGACDVPDLELFPDYVEGVRTVSFHAALEAPWEQLGLWIMAALTRARLVHDWTRHAPAFSSLSERFIRFGSRRGGMRVRMTGVGNDGEETAVNWYLVAGSNHGPEIPCTPAIVVTKKLLRDDISTPGARACMGMFTVDELMGEMSDFDISVQSTGNHAGRGPV